MAATDQFIFFIVLQKNQLLLNISNLQINMSKEIEDLRTRVEEVEIKTATNQLGIKRLKNELTKSNKKIKLLDDKFTTCTELSRYHIKEKEKIPYVFLAPPRNRYFSGR